VPEPLITVSWYSGPVTAVVPWRGRLIMSLELEERRRRWGTERVLEIWPIEDRGFKGFPDGDGPREEEGRLWRSGVRERFVLVLGKGECEDAGRRGGVTVRRDSERVGFTSEVGFTIRGFGELERVRGDSWSAGIGGSGR
jgi:hypothetical protein